MSKKLLSLTTAIFIGTRLFAADPIVPENISGEPTVVPQDTTAILLDEVTISAGVTNVNISPLRLTTVDRKQIQSITTGRTYPELLRNIPSVYATSETGSYGDAKINIRGFKQENISILLNGLPISGLTSGSMFWNNWMGLSDATASIQLQKGIGGSMLSDNSVGGTINIITTSPSAVGGFSLGYSYTGYGTQKANINIASGDLGKGWAFNLMGSYAWGTGFVECTGINSWSYLASISKKFNKKHSLLFTALGSPEQHEQRSQRLTQEEIDKYGVDYSKNWGWYQGRAKTISKNTYFKPYFTLQHFYNTHTGRDGHIDLKVNSALYFAFANGGGFYPEAVNYNKRIITFQSDKGHIDWDAVVANNKTQFSEGHGYASQNIMSDYLAGHTQFGVKSSAIVTFNDRTELETGLHYQMYRTWEKEQITDLLGGDYWYENYASKSLAGEAGRNPYKKVGDYIRTDNGKNINYMTLYALTTFKAGTQRNWIFKVGGTLSGTTIQRWDKYNYIDNIYSKTALGGGGSLKAGVLYKINRGNSLYFNAAAYSRAPYSSVFFASGNNAITKDLRNENNFLGELGYRLVFANGGLEATFYSAYWKNKSMMSDKYKQLDDDEAAYMITGLDAFHYGAELDAFYGFGRWLRLDAFASIGDWRWKNNVEATIYDQYSRLPIDTIYVYSDGMHVGDAPQTQLGASFDFHPFKIPGIIGHRRASSARQAANDRFLSGADLSIKMDWTYNDRFWADFEPSQCTDPGNLSEYRIPAYHLVNLGVTWEQTLSPRLRIAIFFNINNLLDTEYIERGKNSYNTYSRQWSFAGYWGNIRNYNFGLRLSM